MKKLIIISIGLVAFIFFGCNDINTVEPIVDNNQNQLEKITPIDKDYQIKNGESKEIRFNSKYLFNPNDRNNPCGGLLNGCNLEYVYDNEEIRNDLLPRHIYGAQLFVPLEILLNKKPTKVCNVYTIFRNENITERGKIISGNTWGKFKIVKCDSTTNVENCKVLFQGTFKGEIKFNKGTIKLTGKGSLEFKDRFFTALEDQIYYSNKDRLIAWTSNITGKVSPKLLVEN